MFAIIALPSTLASLDNEKDDIVPEKGNAPVEFANKIMRGLEFLATKVEKTHHASKAQPESAVQVESNVNHRTLRAPEARGWKNQPLTVLVPTPQRRRRKMMRSVQAARANITAAALTTQLITAAQA